MFRTLAKMVFAAPALLLLCLTSNIPAAADATSPQSERFVLLDFIPQEYSLTSTPTRTVVTGSKDQDPRFLLWSSPGRAYLTEEILALPGISPTTVAWQGEGCWFDPPDGLKVTQGKMDIGHSQTFVMLWFDGAEHVLQGKVNLWKSGATAESDPSYPLTFKVRKESKGYVYVCGRGTVTTKAGEVQRLGYDDTVDTWLPRLKSDNQLDREGAAEALGWLTQTKEDFDKACPALIDALKDQAMEVRRDAAESLGRIGDERAIDGLTTLTNEETEKEEWVRQVAEESVGLIRIKTAVPRLPEKDALTILTEGLKHSSFLVRRTAAQLLAKAGADAVDPLVLALTDKDSAVRRNAATSLAAIGDQRALEAIKQASAKEQDPDTKTAMEEAIKALEK